MKLLKCIYCTATKHDSQFNREHVMPRAFGSFRNNFVLRELVCQECNDYFSRHFDRVLARDSLEGLQRYDTGLRRLKGDQRIGGSERILGRIQHGDPDIDGALVVWTASGRKDLPMVVDLVPQIGISKDAIQPSRWFSLEDFPHRSQLPDLGLAPPIHLRFLCDLETARSLLKERGYEHRLDAMASTDDVLFQPYSEVDIELRGRIDDVQLRAAAKVAFNYFAFHFPGMAKMDNFKAVREYIRYGRSLPTDFVYVATESPIANVPEGCRLLSHTLCVSWDAKLHRIVSAVSFYGWFVYRVTLSDDFRISPDFVDIGHVFHPESQMIEQLTRIPQPIIALSHHRRIEGMFSGV